MVISDSTNITSREHVYQVNSSKSCIIYYSITRDKNTSPILVSCQDDDEMASRTTSIKEGEDDEDITTIDTTIEPSKLVRIEDDAMSGDFRTLKPP